MGLPIIAVPNYQLTIPSNGQVVNFRPFLVKEEKILLIAMESEEEEQKTGAIRNIIKNCVTEDLDVNIMPMFDIEYIFLKLRSKSKGEEVDLTFDCGKCKKPIAAKVDLSTIEVTRTEGHSNKISFRLEKSDVLDLYAGTGSFGLECLSRYANSVCFIEKEKEAIEILEKNITKLKIKNKTKILSNNVLD